MGTSQLMSVPFSLHANTANTSTNVINEIIDIALDTITASPSTFVNAGNLQFRYNSTGVNGFIEVRLNSSVPIGTNLNLMTFFTKKLPSKFEGNFGAGEFYYAQDIFYHSWRPLFSLWDSSTGTWNPVKLDLYQSIEATIYEIGNGSNQPNPRCWKFHVSISGYHQVFMKVSYKEE